jgi:triosephosphate isomerase
VETGNQLALSPQSKNLLKEPSIRLYSTKTKFVRISNCIYMRNLEVVVSPTNVHLHLVKDLLSSHVLIAAQNASAQGNGAFTGEVSAD